MNTFLFEKPPVGMRDSASASRLILQWALTMFVLAFIAVGASFGQGITGSIAGTVTDPSGTPISGATVTVQEISTGINHLLKTSDAGTYREPQLNPGRYSVHVDAPGFTGFEQRDITLAIDQVEQVNARLTIGSDQQIVDVTSDASVIQTETSSVGLVVESATIQNTPLNGHVSILGLINLVPGVQDVAAQDQVPVRGVTLAFGTNQRNSYGDAGFTFDGVTNEEVELQRGEGEVPPLDSISQFKVITQGAPAEFNQPNQVIVVSASGGNALHGEILEFNRGRGTAAKQWFNGTHAAAPARAPYQRNEYSGNLNGPIYIPHLYNGKDRTFFFASYEGFHLTQSNSVSSIQPTVAERAGDFSCFLPGGSCVSPAQPAVILKNPLTGAAFPGNKINVPFNAVDVQLQNMLMPASQTQVVGAATQELIPHTTDVSRFNLRIDHKVSDRDQIRFTWLRAFYGPFSDVGTSSLAGGVAQDGEHNSIFVVGWTHTFSPTLIMDSYVSYLHLPLYRTAQNYKTDFSSFIPGLGPQLLSGAPTLSITNITGITEAGSKNLEQTYQGNTSVTKVLPRHTLKAGVSYLYNDSWQDSSSHGSFSFNGQYSGIAYADFLLGDPSATGNSLPHDYVVRFNSGQYAIYAQDDWKLTPKLTLNYGVRYDLQHFHDNPYGTESLFVPSVGKIVVFANAYPAVTNPLYQPYTVLAPSVNLPSSMYKYLGQDSNNVAPRFGFAYQAHKTTVVRGAVGLFYNLLPSSYMDTGFSNVPFVNSVNYTNTAGTPTITMNAPFAASASVPANPTINAQHSTVTPYTEQWNLAVEQQLPGAVDLRIGYVGQRTIHQNNHGGPGNTEPDINYAPPGMTTEQSRRPFQGFGTVTENFDPIYHTTGNSLQIGLHKQYRNGFMINAEYQWIRVLGVENHQDPTKIGDSYGPISSITPQTLQISYAYELPFGQNKLLFGRAGNFENKLISGWQVAGFSSFQTGQPFSVTYTAPGSQVYGASGRANIVPGVAIYPSHKTHAEWFNTAAFFAPPAYQFGNSGYDMLRGPNYQNWDMNLEKNTALGKRCKLQLRADVFNVFNHPNFSVPGSAVSNPATNGVISSTVNENRTMEFAAKFNF
ncbi:carboxypeptidase regulatory-like domain-containing protein [Granulicella paludicola]|uniref:carboxypeptidase regulatory-like domain-containing protein n=1 Tax=Granulicella paludicola TaxID=474951 RepID=UPI0021DFF1DA|nr:carboxypeptidase regulatory-like domain-containing protein [Granulicella paludicola]